jgi:hypothetical protein
MIAGRSVPEDDLVGVFILLLFSIFRFRNLREKARGARWLCVWLCIFSLAVFFGFLPRLNESLLESTRCSLFLFLLISLVVMVGWIL